MAWTQKVWTAKQAHAYAGKNAISKFLVKRKLPVLPPFKKRERGLPKQMRGRKKKQPLTTCVGGDRGSGEDHEVQGHRHGHGCGRLSTEGTNRSLTNNKVDGRIEYRNNGSRRDNTPSTMTTAATPLTAPKTNGIYGNIK